jgi:hypothetical protein
LSDIVTSPTPSPREERLNERLELLERQLASIAGEVASIRAELGSPPSPPTSTTNDESRTPTWRPSTARPLDFESLLGRYGMLAIAVLTAVAAVGTFLNWAIHNGYLHVGPAARVLIGLAAAIGLAAWGLRLRKRERAFGSSILGLALVIVQVCAHAAGPVFDLVPSYVAFAGAAVVSWALALFAHVEDDEPLWCVGFGGAALAPFVSSDGTGNLYGLLIYGLIVVLPGCFAISHRNWPIAWRIFYGITALFALAGASLSHRWGVWGFIAAYAFPFVVAAAGVVPFAAPQWKRAALRWLGLLGVVCSFAAPRAAGTEGWLIGGTLIASVALWLYLLDSQATLSQSSVFERTRRHPALLDWVDAAFVPLMVAGAASQALRGTTSRPFDPLLAYLVVLPLFLAFAWRRTVHSLRDASAFAAAASACAVVGMMPAEQPLGRIAAFVFLALLLLLVAHRIRPSVSWVVIGVLILIGAALASGTAMTHRTAYVYTPFATEPSATALVVLLGLICVARFWYMLRTATRTAMGDRPEWTYATNVQALIRGAALAPWTWAFLWILLELSMAYSASTSTLLLVTYFALTAVGCVGAGRAHHSARLRQTGLGLALVAAGTAFYGATSYFDFGARIAAYLVTSGFLLGIAYWYRKPGEHDASHDAPA